MCRAAARPFHLIRKLAKEKRDRNDSRNSRDERPAHAPVCPVLVQNIQSRQRTARIRGKDISMNLNKLDQMQNKFCS